MPQDHNVKTVCACMEGIHENILFNLHEVTGDSELASIREAVMVYASENVGAVAHGMILGLSCEPSSRQLSRSTYVLGVFRLDQEPRAFKVVLNHSFLSAPADFRRAAEHFRVRVALVDIRRVRRAARRRHACHAAISTN